jgi:diacylglycerol kinase (ATP)
MHTKLDESSQSTNLSQRMSEPTSTSIPPIARGQQRVKAWKVATSIGVSFKYAAAGVTYAFSTQRNFRIHCVAATSAIVIGALLGLSNVEMAVACITGGLVLTLELLNTAIESVVDLTVGQTYHELAKIAKDCAAGAVLISAFASILVGLCLIVPKLMILLAL